MFRNMVFCATAISLLAMPAIGETIEIQMLNKGEGKERMIFSPDFVRIQPGDTVKFLATNPGHNAESDDKLWPEGAEMFKGKTNEEIEFTFNEEGLFGVKCKPHYAMGMVMTIAVGDISEAPAGWLEGRVPKKAKTRYEAQLDGLAQ